MLSKLPRDRNCQDVKVAKGPRRRESKGSPKRSKGPRDPCYPNYQEIRIVEMSKLIKVLDIKNPRAPLEDPKVQEIHDVQVTKRSKCPRASSRSPHCLKLSFSSQFHCERPIIGANEPSIVQACNQKKGPSCIVEHVMKVSVTCQCCALILHCSRN